MAAGQEVLDQQPEGFDAVCVAVGSGGTLAGLALGPDIGQTIGFAVCDDAEFFTAKVESIAAEAEQCGFMSALRDNWHVNDAYRGEAYGVAGAEVWDIIATVARLEGLFLDPVYTGKAMLGLVREARAGRLSGRVLFWHTGGGFGLFGRGHEVRT
jgi:1-aminocyclopropane-1-carboxylate deaminase/D-cysteine desulfhydrase-like pyridoxal-dependent ACC family enzyme